MDSDAVRTAATVAAAIGTIGAVLYALYRDLILANRRRPRLDLLFDATGGDAVVVGTQRGTDSAQRVTEWINQCELALVECKSEPEALRLETALKAEHTPPLTKR